MININDASLYKRCQKKKYNVWVCMPPLGTCVINKLEQAQVVKQFNGRTYFTSKEIINLSNNKREVYEFLAKNAYIVDGDKRFVLSGTQGELWTIDANKLAKTYVFAGNANKPDEDINVESIRARFSNKRVGAEPVMNWQLLETRAVKDSNFACQVPANEIFTINTSWGSVLTGNDPSIPHGKGDFVMCPANPDNTPNLNDRWIVNGLIFGDTYDNRGWSQNVVNSGNATKVVEKPAPLFSDKDSKSVEKLDISAELANLLADVNKPVAGELARFTGVTPVVSVAADGNTITFGKNATNKTKDSYEKYAVLKVSDRKDTVGIDFKCLIATYNSKGALYSKETESRVLMGDIDTLYSQISSIVSGKLSKVKVEKRDTRSNKEKAGDLLNIFGKKPPQPKSTLLTTEHIPKDTVKEPEVQVKKAKPKKMYQMVARCTDGFKVTGYMLKPSDNSEPAKRFSRQQTYFLIGKKLVVNCDGKISKEGVSLSGIGTKITDLPMLDENGSIRNAEHTGHVRRGDKAEDIINRNMIVGIVKNGRSTDGYILKGAGGATSFCSKDEVYKLAQDRKIGNVSAQMYNGKLLIRSIPGQPSLSSLPIMDKNGNVLKEKTDFSDYKRGSSQKN